jgi:hypothetical protein
MKKLVGIFVLIISVGTQAFALGPSKDEKDRAADRPSCEMLAWRWANTLVRLNERDVILKQLEETKDYSTFTALSERLPAGAPEGQSPYLKQRLTFNVPGVSSGSVRIIEVNTPSVRWKNVTENFTDLITVKVQDGKIFVDAPIHYADYCFSQLPSEILLEVGGKPLKLTWNTRGLGLNKYLKMAGVL